MQPLHVYWFFQVALEYLSSHMHDPDCTHVYIFHVMFMPLASFALSSHGLKLFCFAKPRGWSSLHSWPLQQTLTTLFLTVLPSPGFHDIALLNFSSTSGHSFHSVHGILYLYPFSQWHVLWAWTCSLFLCSLWKISSLTFSFQEQLLLFLRILHMDIVKYDHTVFALPTSPIAPQHVPSFHIYALYVWGYVHTCVGVWASLCVSN